MMMRLRCYPAEAEPSRLANENSNDVNWVIKTIQQPPTTQGPGNRTLMDGGFTRTVPRSMFNGSCRCVETEPGELCSPILLGLLPTNTEHPNAPSSTGSTTILLQNQGEIAHQIGKPPGGQESMRVVVAEYVADPSHDRSRAPERETRPESLKRN